MYFSDTMGSAMKSLKANKTRSALTMLGIIIGVGSVVLMVSVGRTLETYILDQVDSLGGNVIEIYSAGFEKFGRPTDTIKTGDYEAIRRLNTVYSVAPAIFVTHPVRYGTEERSPYVFGTNSNFFENYGLSLERGRLLDERDEKSAKNVVVLANETAEELFKNKDPLGKKVKIANRSFTVIGVLEAVGSLLLSDLDTPVYMPFSTAKSLTGQKHLSYISLRAQSDDALARADVYSVMRQRHSIDNPDNDPDKDDFIARSTEQATEIIGSVTLGLTIFLGLVAGISLLVGGIGIMNIMLVAVSERTLEIGLRKAVGARRRDILLQFLVEAIWLTFVGGAIGIIGGAGLGLLITLIAEKFVGDARFMLSIPALIAAVAMAVGTGLVFGIYPAQKAAKLDPIAAMRLE